LVDGKSANIVAVYVVEVPQSLPLDADMQDEIDRGDAALDAVAKDAKALCHMKGDHLRTDILQARTAGAAIVDEAATSGATSSSCPPESATSAARPPSARPPTTS
jgi:hypothetical protein